MHIYDRGELGNHHSEDQSGDAHLEDVPPVLPLVIQPFIEHLHDFDKVNAEADVS